MNDRKYWYENRFEPLMRKMRPDIHLTYAIYTNKARAKGFDHRTQNEELREKAAILYALEVEAIDALTEDHDRADRAVVAAFLNFIETKGARLPHKSAWTKKFSKLEFDKIKALIPSFTEIEFKCWSTRPDDEDSLSIQQNKIAFREAYDVYVVDKNGQALIDWYEEFNSQFAK